jgi:membrane protein required for colicin V production
MGENQMHEMMSANGLDYAILGLVLLLGILGLIFGFVRGAICLLTLITAFVLGVVYCGPFSEHFTIVSLGGVRMLLAFIVLVLGTLLLGGIIGYLVSKLIHATGFAMTDRIMGAFFGATLGMMAVSLVIVFVAPSSMAQKPLWKESQLIPHLSPMADWLQENSRRFLEKIQI